MHELQYLTEKDLEYFKRKQAEGDPVRIIYLSPEALDKISFKDLDRMEKEAKEEHGRQPTEEEMEEWLNEHHVITDPPQKKAEEKQEADGADSQAAGGKVKDQAETADTGETNGTAPSSYEADSRKILHIIREGKLTAGDIMLVQQAISAGFSDDELAHLCSLAPGSDRMQLEYERIRKEKNHEQG